jgi:hypothetical protein
MNAGLDPYEVTIPENEVTLSLKHRLALGASGLVVFVAALAGSSAFLFGAFVAFAGSFLPGPIDPRLMLSREFRVWMVCGVALATVVSALLALYVTMRLTQMQRNVLQAVAKRQELLTLLLELQELRAEDSRT